MALSFEGNSNAYNIFFFHFHCLHVLAHKKRYIERLFLYLFLFLPLNRYPAPKTFLCIIEHWHQLFATKLQFLVIFSVPKSTVVTQTLVDWNLSHLLFNICSPFTINNNIIIDFERREEKKMECNTKTEKFAYWIKRK